MADPKPWEKYAAQASTGESGPWSKYASGSPDPTLVTSATGPYKTRDEGPTMADELVEGAKGAGVGALKGMGHTGMALSPLLNKIPYFGEILAPSEGIKAADALMTPKGTAQKVGFTGEQIAEWLLPTGIEEKGGLAAARLLPQLGKAAPVLGRIGAGAIDSGVRNKMQGGDFSTGALMGGGAGAVGEAGKKVAPKLAESALGVTKKMRGFGRTLGESVLNEIKGIRPGTIGANAGDKLSQLTSELESAAAQSTTPATTQPAIDKITSEMQKASKQNNKTLYNALKDVHDQLTVDFASGKALPTQMPASSILDLKRGIGDLEGNWNPELRGKLKGIVRQVYSALDKEFDRAVPGGAELNQRISSLIPVKTRAESVERGADISQRLMHRMAAHTGALTGAVSGGALGYRHGGVKEAVPGAIGGFVLPELLASPSTQMLAARTMRSPVPTRVMKGAASQLMKRGDQSKSSSQ